MRRTAARSFHRRHFIGVFSSVVLLQIAVLSHDCRSPIDARVASDQSRRTTVEAYTSERSTCPIEQALMRARRPCPLRNLPVKKYVISLGRISQGNHSHARTSPMSGRAAAGRSSSVTAMSSWNVPPWMISGTSLRPLGQRHVSAVAVIPEKTMLVAVWCERQPLVERFRRRTVLQTLWIGGAPSGPMFGKDVEDFQERLPATRQAHLGLFDRQPGWL